MSAESRSLTAIIAKIIDARRDEPHITPDSIATAALSEIDPKKVSVPAVVAGCTLALRQIARGLLRKHFEEEPDDDADDDEEEDQFVLFPGLLQQRYPSAQRGASDYVLLQQMSDADIAFNVARLRKEGSSKTKHADALEQFGRDRKKATAA